jgi:hypothetical protein
MKRAAVRVKRKKTGTGAKRKAPRRRATAKLTPVSTKVRHTAAKRKKVAKVKSSQSRRVIAKRKTIPRLPRLKVPAILLEGDEPDLPTISGPGEKFALGPETPVAHFTVEAAHLPAAYGTGRLFLTARDPHWLYAHWDINTSVQFRHNARSVDRHLILRMHENELTGKPTSEIHVHPESRHWFAHVEAAGKQYVADLGYYQPGRKWKSLATSAPMRTPPDTVSTDATAEFATIPLELPFQTMLSLLEEGAERKLPLAHAVQQLRERRLREFPPATPATEWTAEQAQALADILSSAQSKPALRGSEESFGLPTGPFDLPSSFSEHVSSPLGGGEPMDRAFWFQVNAELIIYGSTQPGAKVSIGGKPITLQPDGSFRCRFAMPDGQYELPVVAVSSDNTDGRAVELKFSRATEMFGEVGTQPQDPALSPPPPDDT